MRRHSNDVSSLRRWFRVKFVISYRFVDSRMNHIDIFIMVAFRCTQRSIILYQHYKIRYLNAFSTMIYSITQHLVFTKLRFLTTFHVFLLPLQCIDNFSPREFPGNFV